MAATSELEIKAINGTTTIAVTSRNSANSACQRRRPRENASGLPGIPVSGIRDENRCCATTPTSAITPIMTDRLETSASISGPKSAIF